MATNITENNLRKCRKAAGLTQADVIARLGLQSANRLSRWESGKAMPSVQNAIRLARMYQVAVEEFYSVV